MNPAIIWRREAGHTHRVGAHSVTPLAQSIGIRWRGKLLTGGWLWQFPLAIEVKDEQSGSSTRLPVPDPTRMLVWLLAALTVIVVTVAVARKVAASRTPRRTRQERTKG